MCRFQPGVADDNHAVRIDNNRLSPAELINRSGDLFNASSEITRGIILIGLRLADIPKLDIEIWVRLIFAHLLSDFFGLGSFDRFILG